MAVQRPSLAFGLVLSLLVISQLGETIYLPALPAITQSLACTSSWVQSIVGWFLVAYGLAQFIYGPLSDRFGRRKIILVSILIFLVGTIGAAGADSVYDLILSTLVMGAGIGSGGLMCRTVLRDLYTGPGLQKAYALVGLALVVVPIVAPLVGAYILSISDWRDIFSLMGACGLGLAFILYFWLEETNSYKQQSPLRFRTVFKQYQQVFTHRAFVGNAFCVSLNCASLMAYESVMPFLLQTVLGFDPMTYGYLIILPVFGFLLGTILSGYLSSVLPASQITRSGLLTSWLAGISLLVPGLLGILSAWVLLVPAFIFMLGSGLLFSSTTAGALAPFPKMAGTAGASLGGLQNLSAGLSTLLVSLLPDENQVPMAIAMLALIGLSHIAFTTIAEKIASEVTEEAA